MTTRRFYLISPFLLLPFVLYLSSCSKNPFDRTMDASGGGATGGFAPSGSLTVFSNELKTGGGAYEYPSGDNQTLAFNDRSNPLSQRSIRYSWNGQSVSNTQNSGSVGNPEFIFVGFDLMHTPTLATYNTTPGRDLHGAGYTKVSYFLRGHVSTYTLLKIEVAGPSLPAPMCYIYSDDGMQTDGSACMMKTMPSNWQQDSLQINPHVNLVGLKDFFKATFIYMNPHAGNTQAGQGGMVYFDEIYYQPS